MKAPIFSRILSVERYRQRMQSVGLSLPTLCEQAVDLLDDPLVVSNMRRSFVRTRRSQDGVARYAFSECPLDLEGTMLSRLFTALWGMSEENGWSNRYTSIPGALRGFRDKGMPPHSLVISPHALKRICGTDLDLDEIDKLMLLRGYVSEVEGLKVLVTDLPHNQAMLTAQPILVGNCTRVGNHLGILLRRVDQTIALVEE